MAATTPRPPTWPRSRPCRCAPAACPRSTYALLARAATLWPDRTAVTVLPDAARWPEPLRRTFAELLADVHRYANLLHELGVRRSDAVALMAPNCAELIPATLAAQLAGIAAPAQRRAVAGAPRASCCAAREPACSSRPGPELAPDDLADRAASSPRDGMLDAVLVAAAHRGRGPARAAARRRPGCTSATSASWPPACDPAGFAGDPPRSADLAALFHTGGTTGAPKLAAHTHANEVADAWMLAADAAVRPRVGGVRRAAAVPRQRAGRHPAGAAVQGPAGGVGRAARLPRPRAVRASSGSSWSTTGSPR